MSMSASVPATVQIKRASLLGLFALVALMAAAATWIVLEFAVGMNDSAQASAPAVVVPSGSPVNASPLTSSEVKSIGTFLFGQSSLTAVQRQSIRDYWVGASMPLSAAGVRSIGTYLLGTSRPVTRAQFRMIRNYALGASAGIR